jgi:hypothetical protein
MTDFLSRATSALDRGLKVIPLKPGLKVPFFDDWPKVASSDLAKVREWASKYPDANCGVVTDKLDNGSWVLDVDSPTWFIESCPTLPETLCVKTGGGGLQFHFRHDANSRAKLVNAAIRNPNRGLEGEKETLVELLVTEHQGVWAGSVHPNGKLYEIYRDLPVNAASPRLLEWLRGLGDSASTGTGATYFPRLKGDVNPETLLSDAGLKFERSERDGKVFLNYHQVMGKCLVRGASHALAGEAPNPRQCAFVYRPETRELWHQCFSAGCQVPGQTRVALEHLGLKFSDLVDHGMPVAEALKSFRSRLQLDPTPLDFVVDGLIPAEALTAFAGLSGHGKTWLSLSLAKALVKGGKLWDTWLIRKRTPVLYLVPEVGDRSLKHRLDLLSKQGDTWSDDPAWFAARTFTQGQTLKLGSPEVLAVARHRVVFLDTTIRFIEGEENAASDNQHGLADDVLGLLSQADARAVVLLHHSPKSFRRESEMFLENVLRGSGDIGAMLAAAYGVRLLDDESLVHVECLKPRDFEGPRPFQLRLRPAIDDTGDVAMAGRPGEVGPLKEQETRGRPPVEGQEEKIRRMKELRLAGKSENDISKELGVSRQTLKRWTQKRDQGDLGL